MSVILDALQKARREKAQTNYDSLATDPLPPMAGVPPVGGRPQQRGRLVALIFVFVLLVAGASVGAVAIYFHIAARFRAQSPAGPAQNFAAQSAIMMPAVASPATALSYPVQIPAPAQMSGPSQSAFAVTPFPTAVGGSLLQSSGTPVGSNLQRRLMGGLPVVINDPAMPVSTPISPALAAAMRPGTDLPTPVPLSELKPESNDPLPPPPAPEKRAVTSSSGGFSLGTILYDDNPDQRIAVVNGMSVREGRTYGNFKVLKITQTQVTLQRFGQKPVVLGSAQ